MIPYLDRFSVIGTTDVEYHGDPRDVAIDEQEIDYLLKVYNNHFVHQCQRSDVVWNWSGVRPLCDDESDSPQAVTRDYTLELEQQADEAPLLSVFGGKLTTYRKLAESALVKLAPFYSQMGPAWTKDSYLPGGSADFDGDKLATQLQQQYPWLNAFTCQRMAHNYGSRVEVLFNGITTEVEMGQHFGEGVYQCELDYLIAHEFVQTATDALWRRSKLGLYLTPSQQQLIGDYITEHPLQPAIAAA